MSLQKFEDFIGNYRSRLPVSFDNSLDLYEQIISFIAFLNQVIKNSNNMVDEIVLMRDDLDIFLEKYDKHLSDTLVATLKLWQSTGFLTELINDALQTELDELQIEISKLQTTKLDRNENESITTAMLSPEIKKALNDGVWNFNMNTSNIEDGAVTEQKTSFIKTDSLNRFNENDLILGYIDPLSGFLNTGNFKTTQKIGVENKKYLVVSSVDSYGTQSLREARFITQYDSAKKLIPKFVADVENKSVLLLDPLTAYVQVSLTNALLSSVKMQVEFSNTGVTTAYKSYGSFKIETRLMPKTLEKIETDKGVNAEIANFMELKQSINGFDSTAISNGFIDPSGGGLAGSALYETSDFIPTNGFSFAVSSIKNNDLSLSPLLMRFIAQYDSLKIVVSQNPLDAQSVSVFKLQPTTRFIRVTYPVATQESNVQIEFNNTGVATVYEKYYTPNYLVKQKHLPIANTTPSSGSPLVGEKVVWLGSSVTQGFEWCRLVNSYFSFSALNCGVGGTTISNEGVSSMCNLTRLTGEYGNVTDPITGLVTTTGIAIPLDTKIIFVEGGTNDWARNWVIGDKKISNYDTSTFAGACNQMFKNLTTRHPNALIFIVGTPFGKMPNRASFTNKYGLLNNQNMQSVDYGKVLLEIANLWGITGINIGNVMGINDSNIATTIPDGLHLTTEITQKKASNVIINDLLKIVKI